MGTLKFYGAIGIGFIFLVIVTYRPALCQNNTDQVVSDTPNNKDDDPIQKGLEPLYVMTNKFLDVIQPESKGNIILDAIGNFFCFL